jgi:signal transduction histidine kinase
MPAHEANVDVTRAQAARAPAPRAAGRLARLRSLNAGLIALLAIGIVPFVAISVWSLDAMRGEAVDRAYREGDLVASASAASTRWILEDARQVMATIAGRIERAAAEGGTADCDPIFDRIQSVYPRYRNIVLRRPDGVIACATHGVMPGHAVVDMPWFRDGLAAGGFRAGSVFHAPTLQRWVTLLTHPVRDARGDVAGLLIMPLDAEDLGRRVFAHLRPDAVSVVLDGDGRIIARSADHDAAVEAVGQTVSGELATAVAALRAERTRGGPDATTIARATHLGIDGVRRLHVLHGVPDTSWTVVAALAEDEVLATYRAERTVNVAVILLVLAFALLAGLRLKRALLAPVRTLADTATAVAAGEDDRRAPLDGPAEVRALASHFNHMLDVQRATRRELVANVARQRALLDSMPAGVVAYDPAGRVEYCNARAAQMLGLERDAALGGEAHPGSRLLFDADGARLPVEAFPLHRVLATGQPFDGVVGHLPANDPAADRTSPRVDPTRLAWVQVSAHPERDDAGRLRRVVLAMVDVTAQRLARHLRDAKESAEAASRGKTAFLSRMSHDLRTPLAGVMGWLQLLQRDARVPRDVQSKADLVLAGCRQLLALVDESLDLARIEAGVIPVSLQPVELHRAVRECLALCEPLATARGILLSSPLDDGSPAVAHADPVLLGRVLMNLVSNAIKYDRPGGHVTVVVRSAIDPAGERALAIDVADTGPGLDAGQRAHLFEPYNRLGADAKGTPGNGLGLVIARALARAMAGELEVTSTPGAGACFTLRLPVSVECASRHPVPATWVASIPTAPTTAASTSAPLARRPAATEATSSVDER